MAGGETQLQDRMPPKVRSHTLLILSRPLKHSGVVSSSFLFLFSCRRKHPSFTTCPKFDLTLYLSPSLSQVLKMAASVLMPIGNSPQRKSSLGSATDTDNQFSNWFPTESTSGFDPFQQLLPHFFFFLRDSTDFVREKCSASSAATFLHREGPGEIEVTDRLLDAILPQ